MHIRVGFEGNIKIDDMADFIDIDSTSCDVGSDEHADFSISEIGQDTLACVLGATTMDSFCRYSIINQRFISEVARKLKPGGYLHIATDWFPYAEWITEQFNETKQFTGGVIDRPEFRPLTRFEGQGLTKDHRVTDFLFRT